MRFAQGLLNKEAIVSNLKGFKEKATAVYKENYYFITVTGSVLSCTAAWISYVSRSRHQVIVEERLDQIELKIKKAAAGIKEEEKVVSVWKYMAAFAAVMAGSFGVAYLPSIYPGTILGATLNRRVCGLRARYWLGAETVLIGNSVLIAGYKWETNEGSYRKRLKGAFGLANHGEAEVMGVKNSENPFLIEPLQQKIADESSAGEVNTHFESTVSGSEGQESIVNRKKEVISKSEFERLSKELQIMKEQLAAAGNREGNKVKEEWGFNESQQEKEIAHSKSERHEEVEPVLKLKALQAKIAEMNATVESLEATVSMTQPQKLPVVSTGIIKEKENQRFGALMRIRKRRHVKWHHYFIGWF
eukprot:Nk52_evm69s2657 gene=Nk52_evmTU69s2657